MLFAFSIAPATSDAPDGSFSDVVAEVIKVVRDSGLPQQTDSMFTTIEGEWDECMDVVKRACERCGDFSDRVSLVLKADLRRGHTGELAGKVQRVEAKLAALEERADH